MNTEAPKRSFPTNRNFENVKIIVQRIKTLKLFCLKRLKRSGQLCLFQALKIIVVAILLTVFAESWDSIAYYGFSQRHNWYRSEDETWTKDCHCSDLTTKPCALCGVHSVTHILTISFRFPAFFQQEARMSWKDRATHCVMLKSCLVKLIFPQWCIPYPVTLQSSLARRVRLRCNIGRPNV